ncbi:MAG TPA: hypothetical protein VKA31_07835 [Mariprofundaceae bacterium]|nr:hypothetical protein [Mariprofundaceae bacterium]
MRSSKPIMATAAMTAILTLLLSSCTLGSIDIDLAPGWKAQSMAVWRQAHPDMMALSQDGTWLYITGETQASMLAPSLMAIHLPSGRHQVLLSGLNRADGLKLAPDGSLWIGEEFDAGQVWRIAEPDTFPAEQVIDRTSLSSTNLALTPMPWAGRFSHEGIAFSKDQRYAYLADEHPEGSLYRLNLKTKELQVLHPEGGWLPIRDPDDARGEAKALHASRFNRLEDMETLPDGKILLAETGTGKILMLDDTAQKPAVAVWLQRSEIRHPDNLAWDAKRGWLWITDDDIPSRLWAWTGNRLMQIASHKKAEITGVLVHEDKVYLNLQLKQNGTELTLNITETAQ